MKKCDCHYARTTTISNKQIIRYECWGTKERDECTCNGDQSKCDFYEEVRAKAKRDMQIEELLSTVHVTENNSKQLKMAIATQKWMKLTGGFTPGGDPAYVCPKCQSRESEHIHGVESRNTWNYCPICGTKLEY